LVSRGLGIKNIVNFNVALLAKLMWRLGGKKNQNLCWEIIYSKYGKDGSLKLNIKDKNESLVVERHVKNMRNNNYGIM